MAYWGWLTGGAGLAIIALLHWLALKRTFAVSGRVTALVDRLRHGPPNALEMTHAELVAAMRQATREAFGEAVLEERTQPPVEPQPQPLPRAPLGALNHLVFFAAALLGGCISARLAGGFEVSDALRGDAFAGLIGGAWMPLWLAVGGMLVGFGTRMAGGCTSGHGLCGVSRLQKGSLLATVAFFATAIAVSFLLEALR